MKNIKTVTFSWKTDMDGSYMVDLVSENDGYCLVAVSKGIEKYDDNTVILLSKKKFKKLIKKFGKSKLIKHLERRIDWDSQDIYYNLYDEQIKLTKEVLDEYISKKVSKLGLPPHSYYIAAFDYLYSSSIFK